MRPENILPHLKEYSTSNLRNSWFPVQMLLVGQAQQLQIHLEVPLGLWECKKLLVRQPATSPKAYTGNDD